MEMNEKELGIKRKEEAISQQEIELKNIALQKKEVETKILLMQEESEAVNKQRKIVDKHFKIIKPTWEFETTQEYLDTLKVLNVINDKKRNLDFEVRSTQLKDLLERIKQQEEQGIEYLNKLKMQLVELKSD